MRPQNRKDLFRLRRTKGRRAQCPGQFSFIQLIVPTHQDQHGLAFGHIDEGFYLLLCRHIKGRFRQSLDRNHTRRRKFFD